MATEHLPEQEPMVQVSVEQMERGAYRLLKATTAALGAAALCAFMWPTLHDRFTDNSSSDLIERGDKIIATAPANPDLAAATYRQAAETSKVEMQSYGLAAAFAGLTVGAGALTSKLGAEMDSLDIPR